jgi:diguanylate cyclase (GGDEF)-like protein
MFEHIVKESLGKSAGGRLHAFMIIDIDDFKRINDRWGHMAGDETLSYISKKFSHCFRADDTVGRIGGDEFVVFLKDLPTVESARKKAEEICRYISGPLGGDSNDGAVTCSIGVALYGRDGYDYENLFKNADVALYRAKAKGKNRTEFFSDL